MKNFRKRQAGSAIAYGLIIVAAVTIILTGVMQFVATHIKYASYVHVKESAFHIAESGVYYYRWYLAHEIEDKNQDEILAFWDDDPPGTTEPLIRDYLDNSGNKIGEASIEVSLPTGSPNVIDIVSTGSTLEKPEITRKIKSTLRRSVWSDFVVISDEPVCFDHYWEINGKIMGNNGVHFNGEVTNMVMAGVTSYNDNNHLPTAYNDKPGVWTSDADPSSVFKAGTKYPVPKKDFSGVTAVMNTLKIKGQADGADNSCSGEGCYFDNTALGRHIKLKSNGTMDVCIVSSIKDNSGNNRNHPHRYRKWNNTQTCNSCSGDCLRNFDISGVSVIYVDDNIWLEGTINGQRVTIGASSIADPSAANSNIYIPDHISYSNYDGADALGILAEGDIEILNDTPNILNIDGALVAQKGAVTRPEYNPNCCGSGCVKNKNYLDIYGCVISKGGLHFGFHKESCPNLDLARKIEYDNNLYISPPPYFPADAFYYVDHWEEI